MNGLDGGAHPFVAGRIPGDLQGLKDRHTGGNEGAQGSAKAGHRGFGEEIAKQRQLEFITVQGGGDSRQPDGETQADHQHRQDPGDEEEVPLDEAAQVHDDLGDGRQGPAPEHVLKNSLEFRHDEQHEERHNPHRDGEHDGGIDHRGGDLAADALAFFGKLRQASQDDFQNAA